MLHMQLVLPRPLMQSRLSCARSCWGQYPYDQNPYVDQALVCRRFRDILFSPAPAALWKSFTLAGWQLTSIQYGCGRGRISDKELHAAHWGGRCAP